MSEKELYSIIEGADFIVAGYAFTLREDGLISIFGIDSPHHAAVIDKESNILETNMYDIELDIVMNKYWANNKNQIIDHNYA